MVAASLIIISIAQIILCAMVTIQNKRLRKRISNLEYIAKRHRQWLIEVEREARSNERTIINISDLLHSHLNALKEMEDEETKNNIK